MKKTVFFVAVLSLLLQACETVPWEKKDDLPPVELLEETEAAAAPSPDASQESGLAMAAEKRFSDVPLPMNVKENAQETYVFENSWIEIGRMVYSSKDSVNELAQFYIKECPALDWKFESVIQAEGVKLHFTKPGKVLDVDIHSMGVGRSQQLILNLTPDESRRPQQ